VLSSPREYWLLQSTGIGQQSPDQIVRKSFRNLLCRQSAIWAEPLPAPIERSQQGPRDEGWVTGDEFSRPHAADNQISHAFLITIAFRQQIALLVGGQCGGHQMGRGSFDFIEHAS